MRGMGVWGRGVLGDWKCEVFCQAYSVAVFICEWEDLARALLGSVELHGCTLAVVIGCYCQLVQEIHRAQRYWSILIIATNVF